MNNLGDFIKVPELTGKEKAAILLTELGSFNTDKVFACLNQREKNKLLEAVSSLGNVSIKDEIRVLSETNDFGVRRGISKPVRSDAEILAEMNAQARNRTNMNNDLFEYITKNPDTIASALSAWMRED